jgi:hypothetical protein
LIRQLAEFLFQPCLALLEPLQFRTLVHNFR